MPGVDEYMVNAAERTCKPREHMCKGIPMIENEPHDGATAPEAVPGKTRDALRAAHLYYMQDLTMDAIAHELHTSRSSVSRLLSHARASGLVEISIHSPLDLPSRLEQEILARFEVGAHVIPVPDHASDVDRLERVALSAARILGRFVDSNQTVGIAWGSTMSAMSRHLVPKTTHNTEIVQLNGA